MCLDVSPTVTTASEAQRRSFGVGHDPDSMQPPIFSQDTGLYIPVPQPSLNLDDLQSPTAATRDLRYPTAATRDLRYPTAATREELQHEVAELRGQLRESRARQQALEKRLEREELESLRSIPGHDLTDSSPATNEELKKEVASLRSQLKVRKRCMSFNAIMSNNEEHCLLLPAP